MRLLSSSRDLGTEKMPWGVVHWGRESGETPQPLHFTFATHFLLFYTGVPIFPPVRKRGLLIILSSISFAHKYILSRLMGFPGDSDCKESACNAGDPGSFPGSGKSPGEANGLHIKN